MGADDAVVSNGNADTGATDRPSGDWWSIINTLANSGTEPEQKPQGPSSDLNVVSTIRSAIAAAGEDRAWQDSGVVAHLQSALDIASQGDCDGAKAAALGLTDFVSIAQRNAPASESGSAAAGSVSTNDMPWDHGEHEGGGIHKSTSWDACTLGTEALHTRSDNSRGGGGGSTGSGKSGSPTEEAAAAAVAAVDSGDEADGGQPTASTEKRGSGKGPPKLGARGNGRARGSPGRGLQRNWVSEPDHGRPHKRQRAELPPIPARSLSDPGALNPLRRSNSASAIAPVRGGGGGSGGSEAQQPQPGGSGSSGKSGGSSGGGGAPTIAGTAAADEGFPGHNSVVDVHPASKLLQQAKNATDGGTENSSYWAGKVKHRLGSSTVELFFLSALLPKAVIEHMPPSLFVTDLVQRNSLAIGSEHTVIRCRLDFLTNRQLRKLRTLAELRLAAVSSLQHCAITLVPYLDAQRGLRIIGFVKVDKE